MLEPILTWSFVVVNVGSSLRAILMATRHIHRAAYERNTVGVGGSDLALLKAIVSICTLVATAFLSYLIHISACPSFCNSKMNGNILSFQITPAPRGIISGPVVV